MAIARVIADIISIAILVALVLRDDRMCKELESGVEFIDAEIEEPQKAADFDLHVIYI